MPVMRSDTAPGRVLTGERYLVDWTMRTHTTVADELFNTSDSRTDFTPTLIEMEIEAKMSWLTKILSSGLRHTIRDWNRVQKRPNAATHARRIDGFEPPLHPPARRCWCPSGFRSQRRSSASRGRHPLRSSEVSPRSFPYLSPAIPSPTPHRDGAGKFVSRFH